MKFTDRDVTEFPEVIFEILDDRVIADPGADVTARAARAQRRQDQVARCREVQL